jgi:hypothetical protein
MKIIKQKDKQNAELLAALKGLVDYIDKYHPDFIGDGEHEQIVSARAAIKKAEGKE